MVALGCHIPGFRDKVAELGGLPILPPAGRGVVEEKKNRLRAKRRARQTTVHDDSTEKLHSHLRRDVSALRIQCQARQMAAKLRVLQRREMRANGISITAPAPSTSLPTLRVANCEGNCNCTETKN